jgi:N-acetyl-anhydromuramyl-L-alanine amidase AmpD
MTLNELVKQFQKTLAANGEDLTVDGQFGPRTAAAGDKYALTMTALKRTAPVGTPMAPTPVTPSTGPGSANWRGSDVIPFAKPAGVRMTTRGTYAKGWPKGAVVHYTAGSDRDGAALATIKGGVSDGYTYLCIDADGTLIQAHPVSQWGYHAGESLWKGYIGGLNDEAIGIEICNPGILTQKNGRFYAWYDKSFTNPIPEDQRRYVTQSEYGCPTGWYKKYTMAQELTLIKTLQWLKDNDPSNVFKYENVVGHHECSGLKGLGFWRKSDPGGCLSMSMDTLRSELLKG